MRVRAPNYEAPTTKIEHTKRTHSASYKVKVITPIYGGGVKAGEPDVEMPIRASAIRGQLRYWWRFLKMNNPDKPLEGEALFNAEREIWGGMGDKEDDGNASMVFIKVSGFSSFSKNLIKPCGHYEERISSKTGKTSFPFIFDHGIPPYSLFPAKGKPPKNKGESPQELPHEIILPSSSDFTVSITTNSNTDNEKEWLLINEAFRWWACFGGIGARTRRGLGSVTVEKITPLTEKEVEKYGCELKQLEASSTLDAWKLSINKLQQFRQSPDGRNNRGRSKWPEPDSIRDITINKIKQWDHPIEHKSIRSFPRAAFGLPIIFEIRGNNEPPKTQLEPANSQRMASPVILKALKIQNIYKAIALKLPTHHLDDLTVKLDYVNLRKEVINDKLTKELEKNLPLIFDRSSGHGWWPTDQVDQKTKAEHISPLAKNGETNTLDAFMSYFAKGGK